MTTTTPTTTPRVRAEIRALADKLTAERYDTRCQYGLCDHGGHPVTMPAGVIPTYAHHSDGTTRVVLVRFTRRDIGGWTVVRADNGRRLGWTVRQDHGEHRGRWSVHIDPQAFHGDDVDDVGDLLDTVDARFYNGDGRRFHSPAVEYDRDRAEAAHSIVRWLTRHDAPAVGYGRHRGVDRWADRRRQRR